MNRPLSPDEARTILAARLNDASTQKTKTDSPAVLRLEIPIQPLDPLKWLAAQQEPTRCYFSGRDPGDMQTAGIGIAHSLLEPTQVDCSKLFPIMRRFLSPENPNLRYYGGLAFAPGHIDTDWRSFGACHFFIPRFEVFVKDNQTYLACNVIRDNETGGGIDQALARLHRLRFDDGRVLAAPGKPLTRNDFPGYAEWERNLDRVIGEIRANRYKKTVLARKVVLAFESAIDPAAVLFFLKKHLPSRRCNFLFQWDGKSAFVGSSPERLYKRDKRSITSEAVAGTRSRGKEEQDDIQLARELMDSDKEQREHNFVTDAIETALNPLCASLDVDCRKGLLKLKEGQHLITHIKGILKPHVTDEMVLAALHPTPAVGGTPLDKALEAIASCEPFKRGWYAGVVGTVGHDRADFAVGLRSGLVNENRLCLFSGVGIVDGSIPAAEWKEVEGKISNFMDILDETK
jgi:menaquinone-specific isochorismate synthase